MNNTLTNLAGLTVGELATENPISIRVFEAWKIDYCCGGRTPLTDACAEVGKTVEEFKAALDAQSAGPGDAPRDWSFDTLASMSADIVSMYHEFTRGELLTLEPLAKKVLGVHGDRRPELADVMTLVLALRDDMVPHMLKEEQILFPYVMQLEEAAAGQRATPTPFFGTVKNPVAKMMAEHDRVGELLVSLRAVTEDYSLPESACFSYRELYRRLADFELKTHEHIHIENNLYFPRAIALEDRIGQPATFAAADGCGSSCGH
jgi:regulator of cell morphogenesis and NO signaling